MATINIFRRLVEFSHSQRYQFNAESINQTVGLLFCLGYRIHANTRHLFLIELLLVHYST